MKVLNIRNLPDDVHARLRLRAAAAGHSMEAEARRLIEAAVAEPPRPKLTGAELQERFRKMWGGNKPQNVVDEFLAERRREWGE